jgi:acyl carrier protein
MRVYRTVLIEELSSVAGVDLKELPDSASIRDDVPIDSLALLNVFLRVEERLGIELDEDALSTAATIRDLVACIAAASAPASAP